MVTCFNVALYIMFKILWKYMFLNKNNICNISEVTCQLSHPIYKQPELNRNPGLKHYPARPRLQLVTPTSVWWDEDEDGIHISLMRWSICSDAGLTNRDWSMSDCAYWLILEHSQKSSWQWNCGHLHKLIISKFWCDATST